MSQQLKDKVLQGPPAPTDQGDGWFIHRLLEIVRQELEATGDRDWLVDSVSGQSIRLAEIEPRARSVAAGLHRLGLSPGATLHLALNTRLDFYWPVFGAWLCGAVVSVADPSLATALLKDQQQDTRAAVVVTTAAAAPKFVLANQELEEEDRARHILVIDDGPGTPLPSGTTSFRPLLCNDPKDCPTEASLGTWDAKQVAVVHWSSGTTGRPKGILHMQGYLHWMLKPSKLPRGSMALSTNIFFHQGAFLLPLDGGIFNGFTCCFIREEEFSPTVLLDAIAEYRVQFYMCGLNHFIALANQEAGGRDLTSMFCVMPAGGGVSDDSVLRMKKLFPNLAFAYVFYGSSEVSGVSGTTERGTLGTLLPGVQVYIRDRQTGERLGPGQHGEIMAKTHTMMKGYLNRPEATREFLDSEGFAHMGDIGYYSELGELHYVSRAKDMLKVDNYFFSPLELEELLEARQEVAEACVWGTSDKLGGYDTVHAAIVLSGSLTKAQVLDHVAANLHPRKHITGEVHFVDRIPHNPQGKKLRQELRQKYSTE